MLTTGRECRSPSAAPFPSGPVAGKSDRRGYSGESHLEIDKMIPVVFSFHFISRHEWGWEKLRGPRRTESTR